MGRIVVTDSDRTEHVLEATEGWRVMEIIREAGLPIAADCGGCCACATCHVYVDDGWRETVGAPSAEEADMLDFALEVGDSSRLSCQIEFAPALDGLRVTLAPN